MSTSDVLRMEEYRGRREQRLRQTLALHRGHPFRWRVLRCLVDIAGHLRADRVVAGWIDEYGDPRVHPFAVLDLAAHPPRRHVDPELLLRSWKAGVPAIASAHEVEGVTGSPCTWAVSLGSDGLRLWFVHVESGGPVRALDESDREALLFLAGACGGMLLHRDLDAPAEASPIRADERAGPEIPDGAESAALAAVTDLARCLLDDAGAPEPGPLEYRIEVASGGLPALRDPAGPAAVVDAARRAAPGPLAVGLARTASSWEERGAYAAAAELWGMAYEAACAAGDVSGGGRAARGRARSFRRLARWREAARWYDVARGIARAVGDRGEEAVVLDGTASVHLGRGRVPAARKVLDEARKLAEASGDSDAVGAVRFSLMTVAHTEGRLEEAATHGWESFRSFRRRDARLRALTALGGVFLAARRLGAAEDAFAVVERESDERYYRLYALAGLARVRSARGDREGWEAGLRRLDEAGVEDGAPEFRAEALLEKGNGYRELGDLEAAARWYREAVAVAEEHGVNEYLIRAEGALEELERAEPAASTTAPAPEAREADPEEVAAIRRDLDALRRGLVGVGGS